MKTFFQILFLPLTLLRLLLIVTVTFVLMPFLFLEHKKTVHGGRYHFIVVRCWAQSVLFILGFVVKQNRMPRLSTYMLMPNHRSYIDIFLVGAISPSAFIAKAELLRWPLIGTALRYNRAILVKRESLQSLKQTMQLIEQSLRNGISVTLFPEGTTTRDKGTRSFKSGSFKIAAGLNIPIIPCAIHYSNKSYAWVGNESFVLHFLRTMWKPFHKVTIKFGEPISSTNMDILKENTKKTIDNMLSEFEGDIGATP